VDNVTREMELELLSEHTKVSCAGGRLAYQGELCGRAACIPR
jgi:hypothetical protein